MMELLKDNSTFQTNNYKLINLKLIGKGKSGYSYLAEDHGQKVVLKLMHDEDCSYYNFTKNKADMEADAFKVLSNCGVPIPKLIEVNNAEQYLVKEFIDGKLASELIASEELTENILEQLFSISNSLLDHKINIDYFPNNFVIKE